MFSKCLIFSNKGNISYKDKQLVYKDNKEELVTIPLEDIEVIVLESSQVSISSYLLNNLSEYNITLITCDNKHMPNAILTPYNKHYKTTKIALKQCNMSEPSKKQLWQKIIKQKIENQAHVLKIIKDEDILFNLINKVLSGDTSNVEGYAAKVYWSMLFDDFKRRNNDLVENSALNYGYTIIRSTIAKYIVVSGLIPCLGIHHCSELNNFNLADDLIEPFRPFIDLAVATMPLSEEGLQKENKAMLLSVLHRQCLYRNESVSIINSCKLMCQSFVKCLMEGSSSYLELPKFLLEEK